MRVIQLLSTMNYGDAVSNDALAIYRLLKEAGYNTAIYAENVDAKLRGKGAVLPLKNMPEMKKDDVLVYHLSIGTPLNDRIVEFRCRRVMVYHNVTPPAYFARYNPALEKLCLDGLRGMVNLRNTFSLVIADSGFNKQNLLDAGYTCPIHVAPILIPFGDYEQEPDAETVRRYSDGRKNILFVGRIAPNKKQEDVIRAFDCYRKAYDPDARLILVGSAGGTERYAERLAKYAEALGSGENVIFPGHISFRQILAFYRTADAFLCMSEHEGFCVPLIEAMKFGVPVAARGMCAVPETLGGAGLLLEDGAPEPAAAALHRILTDSTLQARLRNAAAERIATLSHENVSRRILEILRPFIGRAEGVTA